MQCEKKEATHILAGLSYALHKAWNIYILSGVYIPFLIR